MAQGAKVFIGISGWSYKGWRGKFYPKDLPGREQLAYAARCFNSIEINTTFYGQQRPESFARWMEATPKGFVFAVKGPRYVTHVRRLKDAETPLANFFASGVLQLGSKLGAILWQLPPNFRFEAERLTAFLKLLPRDAEAARRLALHHEPRLAGRVWLRRPAHRRLRHALEVRHESFVTPELVKILRAHGVGLVCADAVAWPMLMDLTADFVYCRLHGSEELYASGYDERALRRWAARIEAWSRGGEPEDAKRAIDAAGPHRRSRDVFVYFDNDRKVRAPADARRLMEILGVVPTG
ncbi:MAG TPA: DUF72 domain-containing protein [Dongiaceae bacterium]|nr:DUF72 domain-containing protein [Dongiaceae bacterium]